MSRKPPAPASSPAVQLCAALGFFCARLADGTVRCWGDRFGPFPSPIVGLTGAEQLGCGVDHACARSKDVTRCWGNRTQSASNAVDNVAHEVTALKGALDIASTGRMVCGRWADGSVRCEGEGAVPSWPASDGVDKLAVDGIHPYVCARTKSGWRCLGEGERAMVDAGADARTADDLVFAPPVSCEIRGGLPLCTGSTLPPELGAVSKLVSAGSGHTCALLANGTVRCFGARARDVSSLSEVSDLAIGEQVGCALSGGRVSCFGPGEGGRLGDGMGIELQPTLVDVRDVSQIAGGGAICFRRRDGTAACMSEDSAAIVDVPLAHVSEVSVIGGRDRALACALADGAISCFVPGAAGAPVAVPGVSGARTLRDRCAIVGSEVTCWDLEHTKEGKLTIGNVSAVAGLSGVEALSGSPRLHFARRKSDTFYWGIVPMPSKNDDWGPASGALKLPPYTKIVEVDTVSPWLLLAEDGRLLEGRMRDSDEEVAPVAVPLAKDVSGGGSPCIVSREGTVWCWGRGDDGQLGDGALTEYRKKATRVLGVDGAIAVAAGRGRACALLASGEVKCWGRYVTKGTSTSPTKPVPVRL